MHDICLLMQEHLTTMMRDLPSSNKKRPKKNKLNSDQASKLSIDKDSLLDQTSDSSSEPSVPPGPVTARVLLSFSHSVI